MFPSDSRSSQLPGPLDGVLVADFSRVLAGPLASMFLGDLGATVIKVERPGSGDDTRQWGPPFVAGTSTYYSSVNRNKRSITLDLADDEDLAAAKSLALRADVFVENFLPGRLARFGLDAPSLLPQNPRLVYCSISGFGAGSDFPGYDFLVQAVGGLMSITGQPGSEPTKVGVALVDVLTGLHATIGIMSALRESERSGRGQRVEVNLLSSLLSSLVNQGAAYINGGDTPAAMGNQHPNIAPYETLQAGDGVIAVAVGNDRQFLTFASILGCPALAVDPRFATNAQRVKNRGLLVELLEGVLTGHTVKHWSAKLTDAGVPCGSINDLRAAFDLADELGLDPVATYPLDSTHEMSTLANPLRLSVTPVEYRLPPPGLGEHSDEVRQWLLS